ncbi:hypothetical protein TD95_002658 [Thielaviopsis punctulata]|uniref:DNA repair protein REV1 n=1 Tax=Thielaviopsis punctulata TaxID=72032 RepID=A0A0F4ZKF4_9PEZI|nr:hypothetical protein TD95_002658 [Thielaviopsis punctulata]
MNSALDKKSSQVRRSIEAHKFIDETGEEYEASTFNGFGDYFRRKKIKLQNLDAGIRAASGDKPQIFRGVVAHVSGYTQPSLQVLHKELVQHGAGFLQYLDGKTMATHIIASVLTPKKMAEFARYRIVKPSWVVESIQAGRLLPWTNYKVTMEGARQKTLSVDPDKSLSSQASQQQGSVYKELSERGYYGSQLRKQSASGQWARVESSNSQFQRPAQFRKRPLEDDIVDDPEDNSKDDSNPENEFSSFEIPDEVLDLADQYSLAHNSHASKSHTEKHNVDDIEDDIPEPANPSTTPHTTTLLAPKPTTKLPANPTPEEYNAWLLSDPHYRHASSANPNFLQHFYAESRLHHLSTWKAELKSKMQRLAASSRSSASTTAPAKATTGAHRYIFHVDFDSFFCAISLRKKPEWREVPVAVAHSSSTSSEIASCNYPARRFGVANGMWMKRALELCPGLKVLPYDFPAYEEASEAFYEAVIATGGIVQSVSVDEALIDVSRIIHDATLANGLEGGVDAEQREAEALALRLRETIMKRTGCNVSVGIGGNILQAKVALRKAKPAGQFLLRPESVLDAIGALETKSLPGVATSISGKLASHGITLVQDLRTLSKDRLSILLGPRTGEKLWAYARGIDTAQVGDQPPRKSVSAEVSWGIRFVAQAEAEAFLGNLCGELERRLIAEQVRGRNLTLKVMRRAASAPLESVKHLGHGVCDTFNKSAVFGVPTNTAAELSREAVAMLKSFNFSPGDIRGLGVQLTKLEPVKPSSAPPSSQKRLTFPTARPAFALPPSHSSSAGLSLDDDPITDEPPTPRKDCFRTSSETARAAAQARARDDKATTRLNLTGTQFVLPADADPAVVAELPGDIRQRLLAQGRPRNTDAITSNVSTAPMVPEGLASQIDPEVFAALPEDMKAEVLATYGPPRSDSIQPANNQPHISPRREQHIRHMSTPPRRVNRTKARERMKDAERGLMQTSFRIGTSGAVVSRAVTASTTVSPSRLRTIHVASADNESGGGSGSEGGGGDRGGVTGKEREAISQDFEHIEGLDMEVLQELPPDVRHEVLQEYRRQNPRPHDPDTVFTVPRTRPSSPRPRQSSSLPSISFPALPPKVVFSSLGTSSEDHIQAMLSSWIQGTLEDGPHVDDVDIFGEYIGRVVFEERDMHKAVRLVRWLEWKIRQVDKTEARRAWNEALDRVKRAMREAALARGIPPISI